MLLALALALTATPPIPPPCFTVDEAITAAEKSGGKFLNMIDIDGQNVDQLVFAEIGGTIQMWGVHDGCMVGSPIPLDAVREKGQPA